MNEQKFEIECGFFDSVNDDRLYSAEDMNRPYKRLISNGVFATQQGTPSTDLQVITAIDGMNIIVKKGEGRIGEKWYENPSDIVITVPINNDIVPRIDSVIAQVDNLQNGRVGNIVYREGNPNSNPQPPEINTNENVIEMRLANIYVSRTAREIGQEVITDLRGSSECPWITSLIKQVDTSVLYNQWQAAYQKYYDDQGEEFTDWFNSVKEVLDGDVATKLANKIIDSSLKSFETTLLAENWVLNETTNLYEYNVAREDITENVSVDGVMDLVNQERLGNGYTKSYDGGFKIYTSDLPSENIDITFKYQLANMILGGTENVG